MSVLMMVLVGYEINDNKLRVLEKVDWMDFHSNRKQLRQRVLPAVHQFLSLRNKKSVIVNPVIPVYTLRKKREIKAMSVLSRLPFSLASWRSLSWLNDWNREIHVINLGMTVCKNRDVKIAKVHRKGELVGLVRMVLWTSKDWMGR